MLDDRKAAILRAVVECHIRTAQPVSSAYVAQLGELNVSPATVRNEMAVLEQEGYLFQPHSSAGRVPTDKGYRFFVDSLSGPAPLGPVQAELVRMFFARKHGEIEQTLAQTSGLLSQVTDYAALVVAPSAPEPGRVRSLQLVKLGPRHVLAVAVLGSGTVERRSLELSSPVDDKQVERASAAAVAALVGVPLERVGHVAATGDAMTDAIAGAAVEALRSSETEQAGAHVFVGGAARMAAAFDAVSTIRNVLAILEEQFVLVSLLRDVLDRGLTVAIGAEHGVLPLADCSVVVAPYEVDGERAGTVGVLGPTRMHYDQALAAVAVVSKKLSKALSEGEQTHTTTSRHKTARAGNQGQGGSAGARAASAAGRRAAAGSSGSSGASGARATGGARGTSGASSASSAAGGGAAGTVAAESTTGSPN